VTRDGRRVSADTRYRPRQVFSPRPPVRKYWTRARILHALDDFFAMTKTAPTSTEIWEAGIRRYNQFAAKRGERVPYPIAARIHQFWPTLRDAWREVARDWPPPKRRHVCLQGGVVIWQPPEPELACGACGLPVDEAESVPVDRPWELPPVVTVVDHPSGKHVNCATDPCRFCRRFTPEQLLYLRERVGKVPIGVVADEMNARWPERVAPFTEAAVKLTARRKLKMRTAVNDGALTMRDLEAALGRVSHQGCIKRWVEEGLLKAERRRQAHNGGHGDRPEWVFYPEAIVDFLERHAWAYRWDLLYEPYRTIGMLAWAKHPYATLDELRRFLRRDSLVFWHRHPNGVMEWANFKERFHGPGSGGGWGVPMFEYGELVRIRARMAELKHQRRSEAMKRRRYVEPGYGQHNFWSRTCGKCAWKARGRVGESEPPTRCAKCKGWLRPGRPRKVEAAA
jgi:hypothetical protein